MAGSVNKVILVGNLGADPEARAMQNGDRLVNMRVATSESWKYQKGNRKEKTEWHQVVIWNQALAKVAEAYLKKGSKVYVEGQIQTRKWTDQSGAERYSTEIVLNKFRGELTLLGGGVEKGDGSAPAASVADSRAKRTVPAAGAGYSRGATGGDLDDEIPFAPEWRV